LEPVAGYYMRATSTNTGVPVSMIGHLVADDSISEDLLWRGL